MKNNNLFQMIHNLLILFDKKNNCEIVEVENLLKTDDQYKRSKLISPVDKIFYKEDDFACGFFRSKFKRDIFLITEICDQNVNPPYTNLNLKTMEYFLNIKIRFNSNTDTFCFINGSLNTDPEYFLFFKTAQLNYKMPTVFTTDHIRLIKKFDEEETIIKQKFITKYKTIYDYINDNTFSVS